MQISFEFELNQKVTTPFEEIGIIATLAVDDGGIIYYVKTAAGGNWFKQDQLAAF